MNYIHRSLQNRIEKWIGKGKIIILYGARQVGKTTLVKHILRKFNQQGLYLTCDRVHVRQLFERGNITRILDVIGNRDLIVIDEAQRVNGIGMTLKLLHDEIPGIQIIATGSSSFDLANRLMEPMTGRTITFRLYAFALDELTGLYPDISLDEKLPFFMRFGLYPDIIQQSEQDAEELLANLTESYLYKDILMLERIKKPDFITRLLQLLAMQIGNEVSRNELATSLQVSRDTVNRYLDLLEKTFVIFRLTAFSRNLRKEITKKEKMYFYDLGIRNCLISRFNPVEFREDIGAVWENLLIVERMKLLHNAGISRNRYFWRTHTGKEIDFIESYDDTLDGFEFKWNPKKKKGNWNLFLNTYKNSSVTVINRDNYRRFVLADPSGIVPQSM